MSHSRFAHCLQSDESSHWRERERLFLFLSFSPLCLSPFLPIRLPRSHFIPFFRVPAIVPTFLLYGIKYQAARHNVPLSFWVPFISFSPPPPAPAAPSRASSHPSTPFAKSLCYRRYSRRAQDRFERRRSFLVRRWTLKRNQNFSGSVVYRVRHLPARVAREFRRLVRNRWGEIASVES